MRILYKYNEETCQYERIGVKAPDVLFYISGIVVVAVLMLAAMLVLHDYFFDSPKEISLRQENSALRKNYALLTAELDGIESKLENLSTEDQKLRAKLFGAQIETSSDSRKELNDKNILLSSPSGFRKIVKKIDERSKILLDQSDVVNSYFSGELSIDKAEVEKMQSMPLLQPVKPWSISAVFSGFGMRINPFHKGLYEHPGIDIAMPRGTEVIATASGTVVTVNKASVQAGYGNYIDIDHGNGFVTRYAHLDEINVRNRQKVGKGSVIGTVGSSGGSIAPHLHYEVIREGAPVDPTIYMVAGLSSNEHEQLSTIGKIQNQSLD